VNAEATGEFVDVAQGRVVAVEGLKAAPGGPKLVWDPANGPLRQRPNLPLSALVCAGPHVLSRERPGVPADS